MKLYLIRHGETDYNRQGIVQGGGVDSSLNDLGRQQAEAFFAHYRHLRFDAVYVSALKRTHETLAPWKSLGYEFVADAALNEFNWGWMEGKKPDAAMNAEFQQLKRDWAEGRLDSRIEGGESPLEAWERVRVFLDQIREKHLGQQVLICSHGRTNRILLSQLLGYGLHRMHHFHPDNTGLNILEFYPNLKVRAEVLNDTTHLESLKLSIS